MNRPEPRTSRLRRLATDAGDCARLWAAALGVILAAVVGGAIGTAPLLGALGGLRSVALVVWRNPYRESETIAIAALMIALAAWGFREVVGPGWARRWRPRRLAYAWLAAGLLGFMASIVPCWLAARRLAACEAATAVIDPRWRFDDLMADRAKVPFAEDAARVVLDIDGMLGRSWPPDPPPRHPGVPAGPSFNDALTSLWGFDDHSTLVAWMTGPLSEGLDAAGFQALATARRLADLKTGRYGLDLGPALVDTLVPHIQQVNRAAYLLQAQAALSADAGDIDAALGACLSLLGAARSLGDEPFSISQLARSHVASRAARMVRRALARGEAPISLLARVQSQLLEESRHPTVRIAIRGERAAIFESLRRIGAGEVPPEVIRFGQWPPRKLRGRMAGLVPVVAVWSALERAKMLLKTAELLAIPARPEREHWAAFDAWATANAPTASPAVAWPLRLPTPPDCAAAMTIALSRRLRDESRRQAELRATAILVAAERHRLERGAWPATIAEMHATISSQDVNDPYTGKPFVLARFDGGLAVRSVGPDGIDGMGELDPSNAAAADDFQVIGRDPGLRGRARPSSGSVP